MIKPNYILLLIMSAFILSACGGGGSSSNTTTTTETSNNDNSNTTTENDEDTSTPTFSAVLKIISDNCNNCHGSPTANGAPISLVDHTNISFFGSSIVNRINKDDSDSLFMPQNGSKLSTEDIQTITDWVNAGAPNN